MRSRIGPLAACVALLCAPAALAAGDTSTKPDPVRHHRPRTTRHVSTRHMTTTAVHTSTTGTGTRVTAAPNTQSTSATARLLGTFDISTAAQMSQWKAAGGNAVVIPIYWQQAQASRLGAVSLTGAGSNGDNVVSEIQAAHAAGLSVYLELDLQYPPSWVLSGVPQFVDQGSTVWASSDAGANVRDWIWSAIGREFVASFVSGALTDLSPVLADVAGIRAGGGMYGELGFPQNGSTVNGQPSFWAYDVVAQSGIGIAAGEQATPLRGYVYGSGTAAQDTEWSNWYLGSLANWITWFVQQLRTDGWSGPTYVLNPSFGMRPNFTARSAAYEQQLAYGTDPAVMMNAYDKLANVWPWSDWADDTEPYWYTGDPVASDAAAWRYLLELAQQRGLAAHIMGENTGGGGAVAIHDLMSGALASGYSGVFYLDYPYLTINGLTPYLISQFNLYAAAGS